MPEPLKKVVVLGSNSFAGSDFIDLLLEEGGYQVVGISRSLEKTPLFLSHKKQNTQHFAFEQMDMNHEMPAILDFLDQKQPEYIINFAAQSEVAPSWQYPEHWFETNTVALAKLINHLKERSYLKRYVHISSPEVYGTCQGQIIESAPYNPSTPYAASKAAADMLLTTYAKNFNFPVLIIRTTNYYGPHQQLFKIIPRSVIYLKLGKTIELHGGGQAIKSYIYIRDVSHAEKAIMLNGQLGEIYHVSPDRGYAIREIIGLICHKMGKNFNASVTTVAERLGQDAAYVIDSSKTRQQLNWSPQFPLEKGIENVIEWVGHYWKDILKQPLEYIHKP